LYFRKIFEELLEALHEELFEEVVVLLFSHTCMIYPYTFFVFVVMQINTTICHLKAYVNT